MGPASENAGYVAILDAEDQMTLAASMGPASENAGYGRRLRHHEHQCQASMGPASENAGYDDGRDGAAADDGASMGPTSENAGYDRRPLATHRVTSVLQWVRRPRTPVMPVKHRLPTFVAHGLQWVRRPRTPVMVGVARQR